MTYIHIEDFDVKNRISAICYVSSKKNAETNKLQFRNPTYPGGANVISLEKGKKRIFSKDKEVAEYNELFFIWDY